MQPRHAKAKKAINIVIEPQNAAILGYLQRNVMAAEAKQNNMTIEEEKMFRVVVGEPAPVSLSPVCL